MHMCQYGFYAGEMFLFNKKITAQEALERNLVTREFQEDVFKKETNALVAYYSTLPPKTTSFSKLKCWAFKCSFSFGTDGNQESGLSFIWWIQKH
ncbi:hypothetical protein C0Q70_19326 [Pomacea canaliculata]|uniref:Uncharacterized protein n=1 Tax=Pomacea canaliculata TaxID=400727 RepID=A0A2T7NJ07_POMCA|nr:hypothetical protein C0Q70_19326 [Pomacea canaliculata]